MSDFFTYRKYSFEGTYTYISMFNKSKIIDATNMGKVWRYKLTNDFNLTLEKGFANKEVYKESSLVIVKVEGADNDIYLWDKDAEYFITYYGLSEEYIPYEIK